MVRVTDQIHPYDEDKSHDDDDDDDDDEDDEEEEEEKEEGSRYLPIGITDDDHHWQTESELPYFSSTHARNFSS